jgi:hypothetical protein
MRRDDMNIGWGELTVALLKMGIMTSLLLV